jgi:hypothetical protein
MKLKLKGLKNEIRGDKNQKIFHFIDSWFYGEGDQSK